MNSNIERWLKLSQYWGQQASCPAALILAVVQQESGGNPDATRYEPGYEQRYRSRCMEAAKACGCTVSQAATSYGLMQLMLPLAVGYGAKSIADVLNPDKNIRFGAAHLGVLLQKELKRRSDPVSEALGVHHDINSAVIRAVAGQYNGGGSDSAYARNVCALWQRYTEYLRKE